MPDKITTLKLVDNTDVFPNIKDENIPDTIMRISDLSKYLNQLKSINITGDIDSTTIASDIATFTTADISTLNVSGISHFEGDATFGHNVHVDGNLVVNGIDNIVDKDGNKIVKNETLDEFVKRFYDNCDVAFYMSKEIRNDSDVLSQQGIIFVPYADKVTNLSSFCQGATAKSMYSEDLFPIHVPDIENIVKASDMFSRASCASIIFNNITINGGGYAFAFMRNVKTIGVADGKTAELQGNIWGLFFENGSVVEIGAFDISGATNCGLMFHNCHSLKKLHLKHFRLSFDISDSTAFEQSDLVEIISNLDPVSTAQTLTMGSTNLAKLTQDQILVATGKGWTLA